MTGYDADDYASLAAAHLDRVAGRLNDGIPGVSDADAAWMRLEIAREYVKLAAIRRGLPPGCGAHPAPDAGEVAG